MNKKLKELAKKVNAAQKSFIAADALYTKALASLNADDAAYADNVDSLDAAILVDASWDAWDIARINRNNARDTWDNAIADYQDK